MRKLTKDDINGIYILSMFFSGLILIILGTAIFKSDLMTYIGLGLLGGGMTISIFEILVNRK